CVCVVLHALRRLLFLDIRPSRDRCGLVRRGAPAVGEHRRVVDGPGATFCANPSSPPPSLCMDGYSARARGFARLQTRLSQLAILSRARNCVPRLLCICRTRFAPVLLSTGQRWQSAFHYRDAKGVVYQSADVRALSDLWRVRLADEPELQLVFNDV